MRQYIAKKTIEVNVIDKIICNQCGKEIKVDKGTITEGVFSSEYEWGYFSNKDGESHAFDLCETCYDNMIKGFKIAVSKK